MEGDLTNKEAGNVKKLTTVILILLLTGSASAEYDPIILGKYFSDYINSTLRLEAVIKSRCGYAVTETVNFDAALAEEVQEFKSHDQAKVLAMYTKLGWKENAVNESNNIGNKILTMLSSQGIDPKTACGVVAGYHIAVRDQTKAQWEVAKEKHGKNSNLAQQLTWEKFLKNNPDFADEDGPYRDLGDRLFDEVYSKRVERGILTFENALKIVAEKVYSVIPKTKEPLQ